MKPINGTTLTSLPVSGNYPGIERTAEDDARLRREAERAKRRRLQNDVRHHEEAESRLAEAMSRATARASVRNGQLARTLHATAEGALPSSLDNLRDSAEPAGTAAGQSVSDPVLTERAGSNARQVAEEAPEPAVSLLQRLARGQSRGLLQDCAPLLESIAARLAHGDFQTPGHLVEDRESLACALDFLQGYADVAKGRLDGADRIAKLLIHVRQQLDALNPGTATASSVIVASGQQLQSRAEAKNHNSRTSMEKDRVQAARKARHDDSDDADDVELQTAGSVVVAAGMGGEQGKVANVPESSLDKDQHKRRDDALPLVTLRSI